MKARLLTVLLVSTLVFASTGTVALAQEAGKARRDNGNANSTIVDCSLVQDALSASQGQHGNAIAVAQYNDDAVAVGATATLLMVAITPALARDVDVSGDENVVSTEGDNVEYNAVAQNVIGSIGDVEQWQFGVAIAELATPTPMATPRQPRSTSHRISRSCSTRPRLTTSRAPSAATGRDPKDPGPFSCTSAAAESPHGELVHTLYVRQAYNKIVVS